MTSPQRVTASAVFPQRRQRLHRQLETTCPNRAHCHGAFPLCDLKNVSTTTASRLPPQARARTQRRTQANKGVATQCLWATKNTCADHRHAIDRTSRLALGREAILGRHGDARGGRPAFGRGSDRVLLSKTTVVTIACSLPQIRRIRAGAYDAVKCKAVCVRLASISISRPCTGGRLRNQCRPLRAALPTL